MLICSYLPELCLSNEMLADENWSAEKIYEKTGIKQRHYTRVDEFALDLAERAAQKLLNTSLLKQIDYLIYCTQSPDMLLPNNVSLLQKRLTLSTELGSMEINQGCSGFVYGLSLVKGLLATEQATNVLLLTADTYTKYLDSQDKANRIIFGDGASATLLTRDDKDKIGKFVFYTNGEGEKDLYVDGFGLKPGTSPGKAPKLYMNGPNIFSFVLKQVPPIIEQLLSHNKMTLDDVDHFVFHQANRYMLDHLRKKLNLSEKKFHVYMENMGNTVSSTIPMVLEHLSLTGKLEKGQTLMLVGFGIGYSIAATIIQW